MAQTSETITGDNNELGASTERGIAFIAKVKNLTSGGKVYKCFVRVLEMSRHGFIKDIKTLLDNVDAVFANHRELYEEFHALFFLEERENRAGAVSGQKAFKTYVRRKRKRQEEEEKVKKFAQDLITSGCLSGKICDSEETCAASYRNELEELKLERLNSAIENVKRLDEAVSQNLSSNGETVDVDEYLTPADLKCIEKVYDELEDVGILKSLRSIPAAVLGGILYELVEQRAICEAILAIPSYYENILNNNTNNNTNNNE